MAHAFCPHGYDRFGEKCPQCATAPQPQDPLVAVLERMADLSAYDLRRLSRLCIEAADALVQKSKAEAPKL